MIPIIRSDVSLLAKEHYKILKPLLEKRLKGKGGPLFRFINLNLETILSGKPSRLKEEIIDRIPAISAKNKKILKSIFNYDAFVKDYQKGAYLLAKKINVNTCPYCNRQYTFTLNPSTGKTRPEFDHFYDKATYPYLALSFYNLIPSCHICNSNIKGSEKFSLDTHIHPYVEDFVEDAKFTVELKNKEKPDVDVIQNKYGIDFFYGALDSFNLKLSIRDPITPRKLKAKANIETFKLEELYNQHKDYVIEIVQKAIIYNKTYRESLVVAFPGLFANESDVKRMILSNYTETRDLEKRVLSKLTRDIWEEFKID